MKEKKSLEIAHSNSFRLTHIMYYAHKLNCFKCCFNTDWPKLSSSN